MNEQKKNMNIVIAGGGTGGHLFPGISIAEEFKNISSDNNILFINTGNKIEKKILDNTEFDYRIIPSAGFFNKSIKDKFKSIVKIITSISKASEILEDFQADAVVGVGGYVSVPVLMAAVFKHIPIFIQEQNAVPGMANRVFSYFSRLNFASFGETDMGPDKKLVHTGNPVRKKIKESTYELKLKKTILITGGSQGAKAINNAFMNCIDSIKGKENILFIHQTGENDFEEIEKEYEKKGLNFIAAPFFDDMERLYSMTSFAIARAGASTIAEISCAGIPAIFIPFPHATHNHQFLNAKNLADRYAAVIVEEDEETEKRLAEKINFLIENDQTLMGMSKNMKKTAKPDAAENICKLIIGKLK